MGVSVFNLGSSGAAFEFILLYQQNSITQTAPDGMLPFDASHLGLLVTPCPEVIKHFSCSAQLSLKFILLINVKMPTIVGILTFISRINYRLWHSKPSNSMYLVYFGIYEQIKFYALLS